MSEHDDKTQKPLGQNSRQSGLEAFGGKADEPVDLPRVERQHPVKKPSDKTLYGFVGYDFERECYVYTSPRKRSTNYYRKIGGYPINSEILSRFDEPPADAGFNRVERIYIIQRESSDEFPPMTVFEYHIDDYLSGGLLNHPNFGEQRCPKLVDDARHIWKGMGDAIFVDGDL